MQGGTMKLVIDIDGVICITEGMEYEKAIPNKYRIKVINALYQAGHDITLFTARGTETGMHKWVKLTEKQLKDWGVKYNRLIFGKPAADVYIDDRAFNPDKEQMAHLLLQ